MLDSKSELERAMDRRRWQQRQETREKEREEEKTDFQRMLAERAKKVRSPWEGGAGEVVNCQKVSQAFSSCFQAESFVVTGGSGNNRSNNRSNNTSDQKQQQQPEFQKLKAAFEKT